MTYRKIQQETHKQRLNGETFAKSRSRVFNVLDHLKKIGAETIPFAQKEIARLTNQSVRTVIRAINELEAAGQIIVHMHHDWVDGLYVRVENTYEVVKLALDRLKALVIAKQKRDEERAKMVAALAAATRKRHLSDTAVTSSTNPRYKEESTAPAAQQCVAVTQQLVLSLRSKGWT